MYIIIELQSNADGTLGNIVQTASDINEANSKYHAVLAAAAISQVPVHACTLLDQDGLQIKCESYHHTA